MHENIQPDRMKQPHEDKSTNVLVNEFIAQIAEKLATNKLDQEEALQHRNKVKRLQAEGKDQELREYIKRYMN